MLPPRGTSATEPPGLETSIERGSRRCLLGDSDVGRRAVRQPDSGGAVGVIREERGGDDVIHELLSAGVDDADVGGGELAERSSVSA